MFVTALDVERAFVMYSGSSRTPVPGGGPKMVAVTQLSPGQAGRAGAPGLVLVRSTPVPARPLSCLPAATYRRRRAAAAAVAVAVVLVLFLAVSALLPSPGGGDAAGARPEVAGPVHVVQPGDTFWDIARSLRPQDDPRPLVARLVAAHGSPVLVVGERVPLPAP
jgi:hypothetical protein